MDYLNTSEYESYGLEPETPESWVASASAIINAHCNRPTLWSARIYGAHPANCGTQYPAAELFAAG